MPEATASSQGDTRSRLFFGICFALIPTGASFALVSNILIQLKQEFLLTNYQVGQIGGAALWGMAIPLLIVGPALEFFGLKNAARMAVLCHLAGLTFMLAAAGHAGDPSAFWMLMTGAAILAAGNGMIEVTGNPLVAALYPDEKTKRLNWFHAFFPIGMMAGGITGFLMAGSRFGHWPYQLAVVYVPILIYAWMVLPQRFPRTENAEVGIPIGEMFRHTLTNPFFLMMVCLMAVTTSLELGPMRWIPAVLQAGGLHGILVLVWISSWMVVMRLLSGHFVHRLSPPGMLLTSAILTGSGLLAFSFAQGTWSALAAATIFAWGVAFFFPTMVGTVSERAPRTGSLGIVLMIGAGLGMAGSIGIPQMGRLADGYLADALPTAETSSLLTRVVETFPSYISRAEGTSDLASLGYRQHEVEVALSAAQTALAGNINSDASANALRAIVATAIPNEPLIGEANGILQPAEASGGQQSFRYIAPLALVLVAIFAVMFLRDRARGGYRAVRLERNAGLFLVLAFALGTPSASLVAQARGGSSTAARPPERLRVLFLGDDGHHQPTARAKQILPHLASQGIDLFYTADPADLNVAGLARYHAIMLFNNQANISRDQLNALLGFVAGGKGLVVLHSASASFQNSEEFIRLVGAAFKSHGVGTFAAVRVDSVHPAIRGVPSFTSWDETYIHTKHNPVDRTVLEVRREAGHDEPWTWVRSYGKGRVFYTAWGHDQRTWGQAGFQQLVAQGTRWASGDWALGTLAAAPTPARKALEVPLPTYRRDTVWNVLDTPITEAQVPLPTTQSLQLMTLRPGFSVTSFAVEPMIGNIIDFTWDARGRMWAVETNDYPNNVLPDSVPGTDRILILEDTNRDGKADKVTVFAKGLNLATSLVLANGGVIVGQPPHMLFLKDTNGDDVADERTILSTGWNRSDTHGSVSNLRYGIDNQVWGSNGYNGYRGTVGRRTYGRGALAFGSGYFRLPVDGSELEYVARTSNNTWGLGFTEDGFVFGSTANSRPSNFIHIPLEYYLTAGQQAPTLPDIADRLDIFPLIDIQQVDQFGRYTAGSAHEIYTARAFPREYWNRAAFVAEPTGHLIGQFDLQPNGSGFRAINRWNFMGSRDAWAAPVQIKVGPDGALWVSDFYTLVAQHNPTPRMEGTTCCTTGAGAAYETPNRDKLHGRIYRIAYDSAAAPTLRRLDNATPAQLVAALRHDNMFWRLTAQRLLVERRRQDVVPALVALLTDQTVDALGLNPGALHALWTLHGIGAIPDHPAALAAARSALHHPAASLRRAALMVLPRTASLVDDLFAAGILPDRTSPTSVSYTVPTTILQDANAAVRLQALLTISELPPTAGGARITNALVDMLALPENSRDAWLPDAIGIAGVRRGPAALNAVLGAPAPRDSLAGMGVRRVVQMMAQAEGAGGATPDRAVELITAVPRLAPTVAIGLLRGLAMGWPLESTPEFSVAQRQALATAAQGAPAQVQAAFAALAARWALPTIFTGTP